LRESIAVLESLDEVGMRSTAWGILAEALYRQDDIDRAWEATVVAETLSVDDDAATLSTWRRVRAKIHARRGDVDAAAALAHSAVEVADRTEFVCLAAEAYLDLATVLEMGGAHSGAVDAATRAASLYECKGATTRAAGLRAEWSA
jgi:ATP/maltotriose-dependent transcriptional regulator MalT